MGGTDVSVFVGGLAVPRVLIWILGIGIRAFEKL